MADWLLYVLKGFLLAVGVMMAGVIATIVIILIPAVVTFVVAILVFVVSRIRRMIETWIRKN